MNLRTRLMVSAVVLAGAGLSAVPAGAATTAQKQQFVKDVRFLDPDAVRCL